MKLILIGIHVDGMQAGMHVSLMSVRMYVLHACCIYKRWKKHCNVFYGSLFSSLYVDASDQFLSKLNAESAIVMESFLLDLILHMWIMQY